MLHQFLTDNRNDLIDRCKAKAALRPGPGATDEHLHGIPLFIDQLTKTLRMEQAPNPQLSRNVSGPEGGRESGPSEIGKTATLHGNELLQRGFTVHQVVHGYGDLCQAITDLAHERGATISIDEFRTLNRCLDNGIADAVTEFSRQRDVSAATEQALALSERLGFFAHELRNLLSTAVLALAAIKVGNVGLGGATGAVLDRSMVGLRTLIDRSLAEVRMTVGTSAQKERLSLADFIADVKLSASLEARMRDCRLVVADVDPDLAVDVDRDLLASALGNLLQNAFKYTHKGSEVVLKAHAIGERVLIEVRDCCGGLPPGNAERMFQPFTQGATDRTGLGLGLSISRRSVESNAGVLGVRDIPGTGCVFTIELPRYSRRVRQAQEA